MKTINRSKSLLMVFVIISLLMFSIYASKAVADGTETQTTKSGDKTSTSTVTHKDGEKTAEQEKEQHDAFGRQVEVQNSTNNFQIESVSKVANRKDKIEVEFQVHKGDSPEFKFSYKTEANSTQTKFKFRVDFNKIVEYKNLNGSAYNGTGAVSTYDLSNATWSPLSTVVDQYGTYTITASTSDNVFTLVIHVASQIVKKDNVTITPNALKIDVKINNYAYKGTQTSLALGTKIKTTATQRVENSSYDEENHFASNEKELNMTQAGVSGFFSWANWVYADGKNASVLTSKFQNISSEEHDLSVGEHASRVFFSFNAIQPKKVFWDPKIGVVSQSTSAALQSIAQKYLGTTSLPSGVPGFEFIAVFAMIFVAAGLYRRKID